jgi:AraC-like DNA-binding protein
MTAALQLDADALAHPGCRPSRQRFLVAARDLLDERGPAVTLSEIARRAGLDVDEILQLVASGQGPPATSECQPDWLAGLRDALPARLADRSASLHEVSTALAVSTRTLQRRLAEAGTSWRDEVDAARRKLATQLAGAGEGRKAIAHKVGYSDTRGLRRALRRWNGAEVLT